MWLSDGRRVVVEMPPGYNVFNQPRESIRGAFGAEVVRIREFWAL